MLYALNVANLEQKKNPDLDRGLNVANLNRTVYHTYLLLTFSQKILQKKKINIISYAHVSPVHPIQSVCFNALSGGGHQTMY